jgi:pimeloyl-ACP methyl ester carboxylesterase
LKFTEYGTKEGKSVVYFHGAPGATTECSIFEQYAKKHDLNLMCHDRFAADSSLRGDAYYQHLANIIKNRVPGEQVDIVGFSIGCYVAIQTSLHLTDKVRNLHLVSAAAPLEGGGTKNM